MRGTDPFKVRRKIKTTFKLGDAAHVSTIRVNEKPVFVKNCMKNLNSAVRLPNASSRSVKAAPNKSGDNMYTLDRRKLYLDSCAAYHSFFAKEFLGNIKDGDTTLNDSCNVVTTITNTGG